MGTENGDFTPTCDALIRVPLVSGIGQGGLSGHRN